MARRTNRRYRRPSGPTQLALAFELKMAEAAEASRNPAVQPLPGRQWVRVALFGLLALSALYLALSSFQLLLLGVDDSDNPDPTDTSFSALITWQPLPKRLSLTLIPGNTLIVLPKRGALRWDSVYAYGRAMGDPSFALDLTRASLEGQLGHKVHAVVRFKYSELSRLIDALGGLPMSGKSTAPAAPRLGPEVVTAWRQALVEDPEEALTLQSDDLRSLWSVVAQWKYFPLALAEAWRAFPQVETDLHHADWFFLACEWRGLPLDLIRFHKLPGQSVFVQGRPFWQAEGRTHEASPTPLATPASAVTPEVLAPVATHAPATSPRGRPVSPAQPVTLQSPAVAPDNSKPAAVDQPWVRILNGCGVNGVCRQVAEKLRSEHFVIREQDVTNAKSFNFQHTVIQSPANHLPWARKIAKILHLPNNRILLMTGPRISPAVTLIVGQDHAEALKY